MKRLGFTLLIILSAFGVMGLFENKTPSPSEAQSKMNKHSKVNLSFETKKFPPVREPKRALASNGKVTRHEKVTNLKISDRSLPLGKAYELVEEVLALTNNQYRPDMGKIIKKQDGLIFFRPEQKNILAWPVALDKGRQKLYPISHILHIKSVDPELRQKLTQLGLSEYYYHAPLKLLSVRSTPTKVLQQYEELKAQGLTVRLEVLKELPQLK